MLDKFKLSNGKEVEGILYQYPFGKTDDTYIIAVYPDGVIKCNINAILDMTETKYDESEWEEETQKWWENTLREMIIGTTNSIYNSVIQETNINSMFE